LVLTNENGEIEKIDVTAGDWIYPQPGTWINAGELLMIKHWLSDNDYLVAARAMTAEKEKAAQEAAQKKDDGEYEELDIQNLMLDDSDSSE